MNKKSTSVVLVGAGLILSLVLAFAGTRTISGAARHARQAQPATVKKASEQFKNIQVLKDLPADQLYPTMHFMADSLGIECVDCHVGIPGQVDGEKDDKQMKRTARKMLTMTIEINKENFADHNNGHAVTCYTCHRGSRQPLTIPPKAESAAPKGQP
jgi:3-keto-L-gulonate-6-phosphate decarboxylase